jgi:hypothetical protein
MERHLAGDLNDLGYSAFAASDVFPPGTFVKGDTTKTIEALNNKGFDAVLTIVLLNKEKEKHYTPGRVIHTPYAPYHDRLDLIIIQCMIAFKPRVIMRLVQKFSGKIISMTAI